MKNKPKVGERVEKAASFVEKSEKLLDVGCGTGDMELFIKNKTSQVYGIDNSKESLVVARKRGIITKVVDLNKDKFPFKSNFFDYCTCLDVIEHVNNPEFLLKNIYRVLKKGAKLIISTPNIRFSDHILTLILKGTFPKTSLDPNCYDGGHIHFFTYKDMNSLLKNAGFKIISNEGIINKKERGWKGKIIEKILGKKFMLEFRTPGILIIAQK